MLGISVDSHFTHLAWKETRGQDGGIGPIKYPLVADLTKKIARGLRRATEEAALPCAGCS